MSNDMSMEALFSGAMGFSDEPKYREVSTEAYDGFFDGVSMEMTRSEENLHNLDAFAQITKTNAAQKMRMLKKINLVYGDTRIVPYNAAKSIESYCYAQSLEEEAKAEAVGEKTNAPKGVSEKKKGFFKTMWEGIKKFFSKIWDWIKKLVNKFISLFKRKNNNNDDSSYDIIEPSTPEEKKMYTETINLPDDVWIFDVPKNAQINDGPFKTIINFANLADRSLKEYYRATSSENMGSNDTTGRANASDKMVKTILDASNKLTFVSKVLKGKKFQELYNSVNSSESPSSKKENYINGLSQISSSLQLKSDKRTDKYQYDSSVIALDTLIEWLFGVKPLGKLTIEYFVKRNGIDKNYAAKIAEIESKFVSETDPIYNRIMESFDKFKNLVENTEAGIKKTRDDGTTDDSDNYMAGMYTAAVCIRYVALIIKLIGSTISKVNMSVAKIAKAREEKDIATLWNMYRGHYTGQAGKARKANVQKKPVQKKTNNTDDVKPSSNGFENFRY